MTKTIKLCEVHPFSTSPNLCECTTVLNVDVPDCYIYAVIISNKLLTPESSITQRAPHDLIIFVALNILG